MFQVLESVLGRGIGIGAEYLSPGVRGHNAVTIHVLDQDEVFFQQPRFRAVQGPSVVFPQFDQRLEQIFIVRIISFGDPFVAILTNNQATVREIVFGQGRSRFPAHHAGPIFLLFHVEPPR